MIYTHLRKTLIRNIFRIGMVRTPSHGLLERIGDRVNGKHTNEKSVWRDKKDADNEPKKKKLVVVHEKRESGRKRNSSNVLENCDFCNPYTPLCLFIAVTNALGPSPQSTYSFTELKRDEKLKQVNKCQVVNKWMIFYPVETIPRCSTPKRVCWNRWKVCSTFARTENKLTLKSNHNKCKWFNS